MATSAMIPRPTEKCESGGRSTLYEMITETAAKTNAAIAKTTWGALILTGNKPTPTAQAPADCKGDGKAGAEGTPSEQ